MSRTFDMTTYMILDFADRQQLLQQIALWFDRTLKEYPCADEITDQQQR